MIASMNGLQKPAFRPGSGPARGAPVFHELKREHFGNVYSAYLMAGLHPEAYSNLVIPIGKGMGQKRVLRK